MMDVFSFQEYNRKILTNIEFNWINLSLCISDKPGHLRNSVCLKTSLGESYIILTFFFLQSFSFEDSIVRFFFFLPLKYLFSVIF